MKFLLLTMFWYGAIVQVQASSVAPSVAPFEPVLDVSNNTNNTYPFPSVAPSEPVMDVSNNTYPTIECNTTEEKCVSVGSCHWDSDGQCCTCWAAASECNIDPKTGATKREVCGFECNVWAWEYNKNCELCRCQDVDNGSDSNFTPMMRTRNAYGVFFFWLGPIFALAAGITATCCVENQLSKLAMRLVNAGLILVNCLLIPYCIASSYGFPYDMMFSLIFFIPIYVSMIICHLIALIRLNKAPPPAANQAVGTYTVTTTINNDIHICTVCQKPMRIPPNLDRFMCPMCQAVQAPPPLAVPIAQPVFLGHA